MSGQKILILSTTNLCRNPRVLKEATTLGTAGYDVTVLTLSVGARFEPLDAALMRGAPFRRIVLSGVPSVLDRVGTRFARWLRSTMGLELARALGPVGAIRGAAQKLSADLTIVHTEIPLWSAKSLIQAGRRVAVDMEDWHSEDLLAADRSTRPLSLLRRAEAFALRHARFSMATSHRMAEALTEAYECPQPLVIRNSFPLQSVSRLSRPLEGPPRFVWFSQTIGPGRGLEHFLSLWAATRHPSEVHLLGDEQPGYRERLLSSLPPGRRGDLHFAPFVAPGELPARLAEFDVGLALEQTTPRNRDVTITNKILQYLNAGLAVVATDTAGQREVMDAAPGAGILLPPNDADASDSRILDALLGDPARLRAMQQAARAAAEREFCWERESPRLLAAVATALSDTGVPTGGSLSP
jgi:glycosyltransferase involved in cell wall biosynthesis